MSRRHRAWFGPLTVAAVVLAGYGRLLLSPDSLIVDYERFQSDNATPAVVPRVAGNDLTRLYLPAHRRVVDAIRRDGRIPTWDPTGFGGRPIWANPQSGLWYPPVWLIWASPTPAAWSWVTLAHLAWAGWGAFWLARKVGIGQIGATLAGIAFALSPYMTAQVQAGHVPHVWAASWAGWVVASLIEGVRGRRAGWWRLSGSLGMSVLAGHPQEAYLLGLAAVAIGLVMAARRPRHLIPLTLSLAGAAWLSAIVWLPVAMALSESRTAGGVPLAATEPFAIHGSHLIQLAWPLALGGPTDYRGRGNYAEAQLGPGVLAAALAIAGLILGRRSRTLPWLALIAACWMLAAGRSLGVSEWMRSFVPGYSQMRVPSRTLFLAALAWALLAGIGLEAVRRSLRISVRGIGYQGIALVAAIELIALTWAVIVVTPLRRLPATDALDAAIQRHRTSPQMRIRAPEHRVDADRIDRLRLDTTDLYDWFQLRRSANLYEALYALGSPPRVWTPYDPWGEIYRERFRQAVLDRMGVGLIVSGPGLVSPKDIPVERVDLPGGPVDLYTNPATLPRAHVVPRAWTATDDGWRIALAWLDPREFVLLDADPLPPGPRQPFTTAVYHATANDRVEIDVKTEHPGLLVVTDAWATGWRAWVDEAETPILVGNRAHRVIPLATGGDHRVVMTYEPPGGALGGGLTVVGWLVWGVLGWMWSFKNGNSQA